MVVKFMQVRGYNNVAKRFIQPQGEFNIGMGPIGKQYAQHSVEKIETALKFDVSLRDQVAEIKELLYV